MGLVNMLDITCGSGAESFTVPGGIAGIIHIIILIIQIAVPIMLIIWGMIDFAKSTIGGSEDDIKKGQKIFVRRLIAAIIVFLIITITQLVITAVGSATGSDSDATNSWNCACKIIKNDPNACAGTSGKVTPGA